MSIESGSPARPLGEILARAVRAPITVPWRSQRTLPGAAERKSWARGSTGYDTISHRQYAPGDPSKQIDWQASSRTDGEILVKETREERPIAIAIIIDTGAGMSFGSRAGHSKSAVSQEVVASVVLSAAITAEAVSAISYARGEVQNIIPSTTHPGILHHAITQAGKATARSAPGRTWRDWLWWRNAAKRAASQPASSGLSHALKRVSSERSVVFVISDYTITAHPDDRHALAAACARHDVRCILISDVRERKLPAGFVLLDMSSGEELEVGGESRALYEENFRQRRDRALQLLTEAGCQWVELSTEYDTATFATQVARLLSSAGNRMKDKDHL